MQLKNKKIFMTGGAGFIGAALIERIADDNKIVVYDKLERNSLKERGLTGHKNVTLIEGDVLDKQHLLASIKGSNIVIHLAAVAGIDTVIKSPSKTMEVNLIGTYNVLEAARTLDNLERFIDFSTSEVYGSYAYKMEERGDTAVHAVGEARWTYAISKLAAEHFSHSYHKDHGLSVVSIRPFNIYGPGQVGEGAIHSFVTRALKGLDLEIRGDGDQIRSWCYIDDILEALLLILEKDEVIGEVINIGNPRGTLTILSLAEKIIDLCGSTSKISFVKMGYVDVKLRIPSIDKAKQVLGFQPKIDVDDGLKKTIEWYKQKNRTV